MTRILAKFSTVSVIAAVMTFGLLMTSSRKAEAGSYYGHVESASTIRLNGTNYYAFRHRNAPGWPAANFYWIVPATDVASISLLNISLSQFYLIQRLGVTVSCTYCGSIQSGSIIYWIPETISVGS